MRERKEEEERRGEAVTTTTVSRRCLNEGSRAGTPTLRSLVRRPLVAVAEEIPLTFVRTTLS